MTSCMTKNIKLPLILICCNALLSVATSGPHVLPVPEGVYIYDGYYGQKNYLFSLEDLNGDRQFDLGELESMPVRVLTQVFQKMILSKSATPDQIAQSALLLPNSKLGRLLKELTTSNHDLGELIFSFLAQDLQRMTKITFALREAPISDPSQTDKLRSDFPQHTKTRNGDRPQSCGHHEAADIQQKEYLITTPPQYRWIETTGAGPCYIVTLYDRETKTGFISHIDAPTDLPDSMDRVAQEFKVRNIPLSRLEARIFAGAKDGTECQAWELRTFFKANDVPIIEEDILYSNQSFSIELDLNTGEVFDLPWSIEETEKCKSYEISNEAKKRKDLVSKDRGWGSQLLWPHPASADLGVSRTQPFWILEKQ
mgnify:CR=1 FL=1